jgi:membrane-associated protease RseP (regulator of RpoE activity)
MNVFWLLLFTVGWIVSYLFLYRNMVRKKQASVWVLWLAVMTPMLVWVTLTLIYASHIPLPVVLSLLVFWSMVNWVLLRQSLERLNQQKETALKKQEGKQSPTTPLEPQEIPRPLNPEEENLLNHCFPWSLFALHKVEYRLQAVICQGQLRADSTTAYRQIQAKIRANFGDRFLVLLQENFQGKPFFALVPNPALRTGDPQRQGQSLVRPLGIAIVLGCLTFLTLVLAGTELAGISLESVDRVLSQPQILLRGLPYALGLFLILGCRELGRWLMARFYQVQTTLLYFIPWPLAPLIGTLGAFLKLRSPIPHRQALFDISCIGPTIGLAVSLPLLFWGLAHSEAVALTPYSNLFNVASVHLWRSMLLAVLSRIALGSTLTPDTALALHPVAVAGGLGLIITALNLMPVGQLEGGRMVHAMFGQRGGAIIGQVARALLFLISLVQPEYLLWAVLLLLIRVVDEPALNDVSELNDWRDLVGFVVLGILILIILPMPQSLVRLIT